MDQLNARLAGPQGQARLPRARRRRSAPCAARRSARSKLRVRPTASISPPRGRIRRRLCSGGRSTTSRSSCHSCRTSPRRNTACCCSFSPPWSRTPRPHRRRSATTTLPSATAAAAATLETARKGIIYEHQAVNVPAQRLTSALAKGRRRSRRPGWVATGSLERDGGRRAAPSRTGRTHGAKALAGDEPPVYLELVDTDAEEIRPHRPRRRPAGPSTRNGRGPHHHALRGVL